MAAQVQPTEWLALGFSPDMMMVCICFTIVGSMCIFFHLKLICFVFIDKHGRVFGLDGFIAEGYYH